MIARIVLAACLCALTAAPLAARERTPTSKPQSHKKGASFLADPIEPMKPRDEEKPRAGWNGLYGGINAGAGLGKTDTP
jgi:hypothetical protein